MGISISDVKSKIKHKVFGLIFGAHDGIVSDGELYYKEGRFYYGRKNVNNIIESIEIVNIERLNLLLQKQRIYFDLYPFETKDNWFWNNSVCKPAFIGYQFRLVEFRVGVLATTALNGTNNSVLDTLGSLGSPVVVSDNPNITNVIIKTDENLPNNGYPANSSIGVYFNGKVSASQPRQIQLKINGGSVFNIDMAGEAEVEGGDSGGSPLNKLYVAEVLIEPFNGEIINQNQN